jgi:hypothetical protein
MNVVATPMRRSAFAELQRNAVLLSLAERQSPKMASCKWPSSDRADAGNKPIPIGTLKSIVEAGLAGDDFH